VFASVSDGRTHSNVAGGDVAALRAGPVVRHRAVVRSSPLAPSSLGAKPCGLTGHRAADAALALDRWLRLGGFLPDGETHDAVTAEIGAVLGARVDVAVDAHLEADYEDRAGDDS
jgi:hypothetical protein